MNTPDWAKPKEKDPQEALRNVPIRLSVKDIARLDAIASRSNQSRSSLLERIVTSEIYGDDAKRILGEK